MRPLLEIVANIADRSHVRQITTNRTIRQLYDPVSLWLYVLWSAVPTGSVADGWLNPLLFNDNNNSNDNNSDLTVLSPNGSGELETTNCAINKHNVHTATFRSPIICLYILVATNYLHLRIIKRNDVVKYIRY